MEKKELRDDTTSVQEIENSETLGIKDDQSELKK